MGEDPNQSIRELVNRWCERKELHPLALLLPAWLSNNELTDGWAMLHDAIKHTYVVSKQLPADERETLHRLYVMIDVALRNR